MLSTKAPQGIVILHVLASVQVNPETKKNVIQESDLWKKQEDILLNSIFFPKSHTQQTIYFKMDILLNKPYISRQDEYQIIHFWSMRLELGNFIIELRQ